MIRERGKNIGLTAVDAMIPDCVKEWLIRAQIRVHFKIFFSCKQLCSAVLHWIIHSLTFLYPINYSTEREKYNRK